MKSVQQYIAVLEYLKQKDNPSYVIFISYGLWSLSSCFTQFQTPTNSPPSL